MLSRQATNSADAPNKRLFLLFNAAYWTGAFLLFAAQASLLDADEQWNLSLRRFVLVAWGFVLTTIAHGVFERTTMHFRARLRWAVLSTPPIALICTAGFYVIYHVWRPTSTLEPLPLEEGATLWSYILANYPFHLLLWSSWVGLYLSFCYAQALSRREHDLISVSAQAHRAEVLMLRYQINPHFLFNTLNAISAQIMTGHTREADDMLAALSRFLRHSLSNTDVQTVTLRDEIESQRLYLSIEKARFGERLNVSFDVAANVERATVPSFLLQPIIENAMKHAVAPLDRPVTVTISAIRDGAHLALGVEDNGPAAANSISDGTGTGLENVRARLQAIYGQDAQFTAGARPAGGYGVRIRIPLDALVEHAA